MRLPLPLVLVVLVVNIIVDLLIFRQIKSTHTHNNGRNKVYLYFTAVLYAVLLFAVAIPKKAISNSQLVVIMWTLYAYFSFYIPKYSYLIIYYLARLITAFKKRFSKTIAIVSAAISCLLFVGLWWSALITKNSIDVEQVTVCFDNLPAEFNDFKIVQISDIHTGTYGNDTTFLAKVVDEINTLNPDIVLFTGDIVNRESTELLPFVGTLGLLKAKYGVYSVLGNHDYGDYRKWKTPEDKKNNLQLLKDLERKMGWNLLNNEHVYIHSANDSIAIIGVENWGEPPFSKYGDLNAAYPQLNDSVFKILLTHNPAHWRGQVLDETNIDLTLSGHTHAMQMELQVGDRKYSPAKYRYKEWGGLYERGTQQLYVNIGLGEVGIPARFGATPEVTVITLKKDATK